MSINAIPNNMEKYLAVMFGYNLVFIDSFQFISLDQLVGNFPKEKLKYTFEVFKGKALDLMSKKGIYPHDYMDSFQKFNETKLPTKKQFYSILNDQHVTDDDYKHAKKFGKDLISKIWVNIMICI